MQSRFKKSQTLSKLNRWQTLMSSLITSSQTPFQCLPHTHTHTDTQTSGRARGNVATVPAERSRWSQDWGWGGWLTGGKAGRDGKRAWWVEIGGTNYSGSLCISLLSDIYQTETLCFNDLHCFVIVRSRNRQSFLRWRVHGAIFTLLSRLSAFVGLSSAF